MASTRRRSPSPVGTAREPSWLNFREAAQVRKRANRARRQIMGALSMAHAAVWASQGALPALLSCALLGTRGHVGLDEMCLMGACHQLGAGLAAIRASCGGFACGETAKASVERVRRGRDEVMNRGRRCCSRRRRSGRWA